MIERHRQGGDETVAGRIAATLAARIIAGEAAPGARLRQDDLAAEFGASHVPVREAFRRLEAQGLVERLPRRGVRVPPLDPAAIREVTAMRAALETLALAHALPRMTAADIAGARAALAAGNGSAAIRDWEQANRGFHRALVAPCAMPRLLAAIDDLHRADARFLFATWRRLGWQDRSAEEHDSILAAVVAGDTAAACARLGRHIEAAGAALAAAVA